MLDQIVMSCNEEVMSSSEIVCNHMESTVIEDKPLFLGFSIIRTNYNK